MAESDIGQTVILEFRDEAGRDWHAGATLTSLRPVYDADSPERRKLSEGDGMKLTGFKVVI